VQWDIVGLKENAELVRVLLNAEQEFAAVKIQMHGHKNQDELKSFYEKAHVFFLPSRGENYGHAIAEALSYGLPVAISDMTPWKNMEEEFAGKISSLNPWKLSESLDFFMGLTIEEYRRWSEGAVKYASQHVNSPETLALNKALFK
jgi:glycosyltransferase involved in cell wall biosynthesis